MTRVAVCLLFIAIFQNGIQKSSQADNSTTEEVTESSGKDTNVTTEVSSNMRADADDHLKKSEDITQDETKKDKDSSKEPEERKETQKKETSTGTIEPGKSKNSRPQKQLPSGIEITGKILGPVMKARAKFGDAVSKGMDGAKDAAEGAFNFFRDSVTTFLN